MNNRIISFARIAALLSLTFTLSACGSMYQEPSASNGQGVASISADNPFLSSKMVTVKEIDGKELAAFYPWGAMMSYRVLPGTHQFVVETEFKIEWYSRYISRNTLHATIKANHQYIAKANVNGDVLTVWIDDKNGGTVSNVVSTTSYQTKPISSEEIAGAITQASIKY